MLVALQCFSIICSKSLRMNILVACCLDLEAWSLGLGYPVLTI